MNERFKEALREALREALNNVKIRIRLLFTRGVVRIVYEGEDGKIQTLQVTGLSEEASDKVEHAEPYGLAVHPLAGAEAFLASVLGQRSHLIALIVGDSRYRPKGLKPGEVMVWSKYGQKIHLKGDGGIAITAPAPVTINAPEVTLNTDKAVINSDNINLGGEGGTRVARIGDKVRVTRGSSAGEYKIITGSDKVRAT